jgi:hypothetical protein
MSNLTTFVLLTLFKVDDRFNLSWVLYVDNLTGETHLEQTSSVDLYYKDITLNIIASGYVGKTIDYVTDELFTRTRKYAVDLYKKMVGLIPSVNTLLEHYVLMICILDLLFDTIWSYKGQAKLNQTLKSFTELYKEVKRHVDQYSSKHQPKKEKAIR